MLLPEKAANLTKGKKASGHVTDCVNSTLSWNAVRWSCPSTLGDTKNQITLRPTYVGNYSRAHTMRGSCDSLQFQYP